MALDTILILDWIKFGASILFALISLLIYRKVREDGEGAMSSFQLNTAQVVAEYKMMLAGKVLMVVTMGFYLYQGITSSSIALQVGKVLYTVYILVITTILYRWVRRFQ